MSMYVRIKRKIQTIFLHVEPSDSFGIIKKQLGEICGVESPSILLYAPDKVRELPDLATITDHDIKNDAILYMVFKKSQGDGFEEIDVVDSETPGGRKA